MDLKEIRALIDLMKKNGIAVFKMERDDFRITLKTAEASAPQIASFSPPVALPVPAARPTSTEAAEDTESASQEGIKEIVSPMVGTFYSSPSPEAPAFVEVGKQVTPETVVCIVEAMKVMNEIKAEISGTITEVVAQNGKPVQFGQTLFRVR
ncbi:MAG: acetyl-CoA carboxylase biotin carboxyl carrier protein [Verrucomicrobia bacterium]|nr:MAG: acetyl-CoA carboxylase biotin carboxyl carrier protein [Verrucomicrobiota bacterium]